ncbi:5'/3'-nucleotidase SurE [Alkalicoccobacillus murimartini]|uniref:5'-nucleotidase SurE n=1 Tax=Alkalicoccobacillus murimartini TaxID=171685 RepID=A0ABT9YLM9_9BACI|nr:5'/3'-nucleotidase SurE [Alkalicoccobacillus murimartini]MDQ0208498.1 5'-nucleotidase [Alkalicoccobacillus murimartini]
MKILVTNDDGIFSPGVAALVEVLQHFGEPIVVCPDQKKSGVSHSVTLRQPLKATVVKVFGENVKSWAVNGTPADCIRLGLDVLLNEKPDFVISGMNVGATVGRDIYYSGTMAAAVEASLYHVPGMAISVDRLSAEDLKYQMPKNLLYGLLENLLNQRLLKHVFFNINLPYIDKKDCKGIYPVAPDFSVSRYKYVELNDPDGCVYYWVKDRLKQPLLYQEGMDFAKLKEGYITISPLEGKLSQRKQLKKLEKWFPINAGSIDQKERKQS